NYQQAIMDILRGIDVYCLTHIGKTEESRFAKMRFMGLLIRKTLQCHLGQIRPTDRDSYRNKRIHAAGDTYAKAIKTFFNQTVVMPIRRQIMRYFKSSSFSQVNLTNLITTAVFAEEFQRSIVRTINIGNSATMHVKQ